MSRPEHYIDWALTTWEGSRRAQLSRSLSLTVRERLEAVEELCEIAQRLQSTKRERRASRRSLPETGE